MKPRNASWWSRQRRQGLVADVLSRRPWSAPASRGFVDEAFNGLAEAPSKKRARTPPPTC